MGASNYQHFSPFPEMVFKGLFSMVKMLNVKLHDSFVKGKR